MVSINIPMIKNLNPVVLASQIVGVQPMTGAVGKIHTLKVNSSDDLIPNAKFILIEDSLFAEPGSFVVDADPDVEHWIKTQPADQWVAVSMPFGRYIVTEELYIVLALRWS